MKVRNVASLAASLCSVAWSLPALAQSGIYVEFFVGGDTCPCNPSSFGDGWVPVTGFPNRHGGCACAGSAEPGLANGSPVTFTGNNGTTYRVFNANGSAIGNITVNGSGFTLLVGRSNSLSPPFTDQFNPLPAEGGSTVGNVSAGGGTVQIRSKGVVGTVSASNVVRVDATTNIGAVSCSGPVGTVQASSVAGVFGTSVNAVLLTPWETGAVPATFTGSITASTGDVTTVTLTGAARMAGTIHADNGVIGSVSSLTGIGPASGTPSDIRSKSGITSIAAPTINAAINARFGGGTGFVQTVTSSSSTGTFTGSLSAAGIGPSGTGLTVAGTMPASVTIGGPVQKAITVTGLTTGVVNISGAVSQPVAFNGGYSASTLTMGGALSSTLTVAGNLTAPTTIGSTTSTGAVSISGGIPSAALTIIGDHAGTLSVSGVASGLIRVGGAMGAPAAGSMKFGTASTPGLNGQVIVNSSGSVAPPNNWTGAVKFRGGALTITPVANEYPNPSTDLGDDNNGGADGNTDGGAVGHAPFLLHDEDCVPVNSGTYSTPPTVLPEFGVWQFVDPAYAAPYAAIYPPLSNIRTRFYGPVRRSGVSGAQNQGVAVQRFNTTTSLWDDVTGAFTVSGPGDTDSLVRDLGTTTAVCTSYQPGLYRLVRNSDAGTSASRLRCANVTANPEVAQFARYFKFNVQCNPADVGMVGGLEGPDGQLDNNDFIVFIDMFFAQNPKADLGTVGGLHGQDGLWDNNDYIAAIDIFFYGCINTTPCPPGGRQTSNVPQVPFPHTSDPATDRELNALFIMFYATGDVRVLFLILETYFAPRP